MQNEERTEMSLSQLAFSVMGDSDKSDVTKLDMNYVLLNFCRTLVKDQMRDVGIKIEPHQALNIGNRGTEVNLIGQHMLGLIGKMENNTWITYNNNQTKYKLDDAQKNRVFGRILRNNTSEEMEELLVHVSDLLLKNNNAFFQQIPLLHQTNGPIEFELTEEQTLALRLDELDALTAPQPTEFVVDNLQDLLD